MPVTQWSVTTAMTIYFIGAGPGAADLITVARSAVYSAAAQSAYMPASIMPRGSAGAVARPDAAGDRHRPAWT